MYTGCTKAGVPRETSEGEDGHRDGASQSELSGSSSVLDFSLTHREALQCKVYRRVSRSVRGWKANSKVFSFLCKAKQAPGKAIKGSQRADSRH